MDRKAWLEKLEKFQRDFPQQDKMRQSLIKLHGLEIEEMLKKLGRKWVGIESMDMLSESQKEMRRCVIHQHDGQWRVTLWFGTCFFPGSIPDFFDADGEYFYARDVKGQCAKAMITIVHHETPRFRLILHDKFQNIFGKQHEEMNFGAIGDLRENLNNIINSFS